MTLFSPIRTLCLTVALVAAGASAHAQGGPGGGGMHGGGGGMGMPGGGGMRMPGGDGMSRGGPPPDGGSGSPRSSMRGGLQLGPPGRWWDDHKFAKNLGLNGDQQKRMDGVFGQNRDALVSRYENLQKAEQRLESLTRQAHPSEGALFAEIDHVAQARAELEKANTHMLLQIRDEMTPDQLNKLEDHR